MSQERIAGLAGCSTAAIRAYESGSRPLPVEVLEKVLIGLGSSLAEFFEAKIPQAYENPMHAELHEKLQTILDAGEPYASGIALNLDCICRCAVGTPPRKRKYSPDEMPLPGDIVELPSGKEIIVGTRGKRRSQG